jgi:hypothetical protein
MRCPVLIPSRRLGHPSRDARSSSWLSHKLGEARRDGGNLQWPSGFTRPCDDRVRRAGQARGRRWRSPHRRTFVRQPPCLALDPRDSDRRRAVTGAPVHRPTRARARRPSRVAASSRRRRKYGACARYRTPPAPRFATATLTRRRAARRASRAASGGRSRRVDRPTPRASGNGASIHPTRCSRSVGATSRPARGLSQP